LSHIRLLITVLTLSASALSFASYTLFIKYLGASPAMDALFYASSVPLSLAGTCSGVLLYLLPPHLARLRAQQQGCVLRVFSYGVGAAVFASCAVIGAWKHWQPDHAPACLLIGFVVVAGLSLIATLAVCLGQARGAYLGSGLMPFVASTGLGLGAFAAVRWHAESLLLVGQLIGAAGSVAVAAQGLVFHRLRGVTLDVRLGMRALRPLKPHALAIVLGTTAFTLFQPIDALLCSQLGDGAVTIMAYAVRVVVATGTAVSLGAFAVAARTSHEAFLAGGPSGLRSLAYREVARICAFGTLIWVVYALGASRLLVAVLQSSSLPVHSIDRLTDVLFWMLLGVGPMSAVPYLFRVFYSQSHFGVAAAIGVCIAPAYGALAWLGMNRLGLTALGYSYAAVWWVAFSACLLCLRWTLRDSGSGSAS